MPTLLDLSINMRRRAAALPKAVDGLKVNLAARLVEELTFATPVDTSQAISNWTVGIGEAPRNYLNPLFLGSKGSTEAASTYQAYADALLVLQGSIPGTPVYVSNNAPYINRLNQGSSTQAPAGFIEISSMNASASMSNLRLNLDGR